MTKNMTSDMTVKKLNFSSRELIGYSLGGLMYTPAHNSKASCFLTEQKYASLRSIAFCLEDAIADGSEEIAMEQLCRTFYDIDKAVENNIISIEKLPYIFVRVKYPEQMSRVAEFSGELLTGFIFPKFNVNNAQNFLQTLSNINATADNIIYGMPILESSDVSDTRYRKEILTELKDITDRYSDYITNIRIGGNDFCNRFGVRRNIDNTIYDIRVISDIISDIVSIFSPAYTVSAPVWEYFDNNSGDESWKKGLIKETEMDLLNGLFGKTVIHPSQLSVVNSMLAVPENDYRDALDILSWSDEKLAVSKSFSGNRMNEQKVHANWARKVIIRAMIYGIRERRKEI